MQQQHRQALGSAKVCEAAGAAKGIILRPPQREILRKIDGGGDLLAVLGTGHGKSLCFQLPLLLALVVDGKAPLAVLFVPLISLANDMTRRCNSLARKMGFEGRFAIRTRSADEDGEEEDESSDEEDEAQMEVEVVVHEEREGWAAMSDGRCGACAACLPLRFGHPGKGKPPKCRGVCAPLEALRKYSLQPCRGCKSGGSCTLRQQAASSSPTTGTSTRLQSRLPLSPAETSASSAAAPAPLTREDLERVWHSEIKHRATPHDRSCLRVPADRTIARFAQLPTSSVPRQILRLDGPRLLVTTLEMYASESRGAQAIRLALTECGRYAVNVVDEAHCASRQSAAKYRPETYGIAGEHFTRMDERIVSHFRGAVPRPVRWAFTGTLGPSLEPEVISTLGLDESSLQRYHGPQDRPNTAYVRYALTLIARRTLCRWCCCSSPDPNPPRLRLSLPWVARESLAAMVHRAYQLVLDTMPPFAHEGLHLIYVPSAKQCIEFAEAVTEYGVPAEAYCTGKHPKTGEPLMTKKEKQAAEARWLRGDARVMLATDAYGMGIDRWIALVLKFGSGDLITLVQQLGRAGRTWNRPALGVMVTEPRLLRTQLMVMGADVSAAEEKPLVDSLSAQVDTDCCRARFLAEFGGAREPSWVGCCDGCIRDAERRCVSVDAFDAAQAAAAAAGVEPHHQKAAIQVANSLLVRRQRSVEAREAALHVLDAVAEATKPSVPGEPASPPSFMTVVKAEGGSFRMPSGLFATPSHHVALVLALCGARALLWSRHGRERRFGLRLSASEDWRLRLRKNASPFYVRLWGAPASAALHPIPSAEAPSIRDEIANASETQGYVHECLQAEATLSRLHHLLLASAQPQVLLQRTPALLRGALDARFPSAAAPPPLPVDDDPLDASMASRRYSGVFAAAGDYDASMCSPQRSPPRRSHMGAPPSRDRAPLRERPEASPPLKSRSAHKPEAEEAKPAPAPRRSRRSGALQAWQGGE